MRMNRLLSLSVLTALVLAVSGCEDEPEQTRERLDRAIGQKEVQDLFRDEGEGDEGSSPREDPQEADDEGQR